MHLLKTTKHPVLMTCNDEMPLGQIVMARQTGTGCTVLVESVRFKRVDPTSMMRISRRVLSSEGVDIEPDALQILIDGNPGDIRALRCAGLYQDIERFACGCTNCSKDIFHIAKRR